MSKLNINRLYAINGIMILLVVLSHGLNIKNDYASSSFYLYFIQGIFTSLIALFLSYLNIKKINMSILMSFVFMLSLPSQSTFFLLQMFYSKLMNNPINYVVSDFGVKIMILIQTIYSGIIILYSCYALLFKHKSLKEVAI